MDDVEKQFEDVAREEQKLLEAVDELKARMGENLPYEELIARFKEEVRVYKEKIEEDSITFEEKHKDSSSVCKRGSGKYKWKQTRAALSSESFSRDSYTNHSV